MIAYQTGIEGVYVGPVTCDESPLEPGVFLIPAGAVTVAPPDAPAGKIVRWDGAKWNVEDVPEPEPEPEPEPTWDSVRQQRNALLDASDWTQISDAALTDAKKQAWADYRQALRDVPQNFDSPDDVVWPEVP